MKVKSWLFPLILLLLTGLEYGDQLFEYGNLVHFTTKKDLTNRP